MKKNIIKERSFDFALQIIEIYKCLCDNKKEYVLSKQVLKSGTSIGAMVREAEHAESKADFIHKIAIAQKEANETQYWLELLYQSTYIDKKEYNNIITKLNESQKIISSILLTAKGKRRK